VEFASWRYPLELPGFWRAIQQDMSRNVRCSKSDVSANVKTRDLECRVCGYQHGLTCAHIIPVAENIWV
jgi:hypothetical protein